MQLLSQRVIPALVRVLLVRYRSCHPVLGYQAAGFMPLIALEQSCQGSHYLYTAAMTHRPNTRLAREAVLEAAWICTNLACAGSEPAAAVLAAAPALILHLDCAHGHEVAEQCAWALGKPPVMNRHCFSM